MIITVFDIIINKILKYFGAPAKPDENRLKIFWLYFLSILLIGVTFCFFLNIILKDPVIKLILGSGMICLGYTLSKSKVSPEKTLQLTRWWLGEGRWTDAFKALRK